MEVETQNIQDRQDIQDLKTEEQRSITAIDSSKQENYRIWKKNAPLLYNHLQTSSLLWPSLSIEWFPDVELSSDTPFNTQRLLLGSFSSGFNKFESLQLFNVSIPDHISRLPLHDFDYDPTLKEFVYSGQSPNSSNNNNNNSSNNHNGTEIRNSLNLIQRIPHIGDINKTKYMPSNPDLIATSSSNGSVRIYDRTKKSNNYLDSELDSDLSDISLDYHSIECWALDWNNLQPSVLATGSNDGMVAVWDLNSQFMKPDKINSNNDNSLLLGQQKKFKTCIINDPVIAISAHDYGVNDIKWVKNHDKLFGTVGEDGSFKLWDTRLSNTENKVLEFKASPSNQGINTLDWNPTDGFKFVLGCVDGKVITNDARKLGEAEYKFDAHHAGLTGTKFNPKRGDILATSSEDGLVKLWKGDQCIFVHAGHLLGVSDIAWSPNDDMVIASCSEDNSVHVWDPVLF